MYDTPNSKKIQWSVLETDDDVDEQVITVNSCEFYEEMCLTEDSFVTSKINKGKITWL